MQNAWFVLYHLYSTSTSYDKSGLEAFERDLEIAKKLGVRYVIVEDYYRNFNWGEYTVPWNERTFREVIGAIHSNGMLFFPYTDATEINADSETCITHRDWLVRDRMGREYTGFLSMFLPMSYRGHSFHLKLVCPKSGWREHYIRECKTLLEKYDADGIYVDRADHRVACAAHPGFSEGLVDMMADLRDALTEKRKKMIVNNCGMRPDYEMRKILNLSDYVLAELLPGGEFSHILKPFLYRAGSFIYRARGIVQPLSNASQQISRRLTGELSNPDVIVKKLAELKAAVDRPVFVFTHRVDATGAGIAMEAARRTGDSICLFSVKRLYESENIQLLSKLI